MKKAKSNAKSNAKPKKPKARPRAHAKRRRPDLATMAAETRRRVQTPRQAALLPEVQDADLDATCRMIADARELSARGRALEAEAKPTALRQMQDKGYAGYKAHGVELARIPGGEELRVRVTMRTDNLGVREDQEPEDQPGADE